MSFEKTTGSYKNGYFVWDEFINRLQFISRDTRFTTPAAPTGSISGKTEQSHRNVDYVDPIAQAKYRKKFQRRVKITEPEVVTLQDIKDVAIFNTNPKDLTPEFINYFHTVSMDKFLRSLLLWDSMQHRRSERQRKIHQPLCDVIEGIIGDNLSDLRSLVATNYATLVMGLDDAHIYHHMANKNNVSLSEKDRRLFETTVTMAIEVVWIAMQRKNHSLIETEMNRMFRSEYFSSQEVMRSRTQSYCPSRVELKILIGRVYKQEKKLKQRSPTVQELIFADHDFRMLAIGVLHIEPYDDRQQFLAIAYGAPEETLSSYKVTIGILGKPRKLFSVMLKLLTKPKKKQGFKLSETDGKNDELTMIDVPPFNLPPKKDHSDMKIDITLPKVPFEFTETEANREARLKQCKMWRNYLIKAEYLMTTDTASLMVSARTSLLTWT